MDHESPGGFCLIVGYPLCRFVAVTAGYGQTYRQQDTFKSGQYRMESATIGMKSKTNALVTDWG